MTASDGDVTLKSFLSRMATLGTRSAGVGGFRMKTASQDIGVELYRAGGEFGQAYIEHTLPDETVAQRAAVLEGKIMTLHLLGTVTGQEVAGLRKDLQRLMEKRKDGFKYY
ncbi:MAG TPA: hypothetical protein VK983_05775 [Candidatus Limnocylindrales bacterium]|nr:hypothetical protein [Candidatus Limnocylindrales bacterium]